MCTCTMQIKLVSQIVYIKFILIFFIQLLYTDPLYFMEFDCLGVNLSITCCILQISSPNSLRQFGGLVPRILSVRRHMFGWMVICGRGHTTGKTTLLSITMIASICMGTHGWTGFALIQPLLYVKKTKVRNILQFNAMNFF